MGLTRLLLHAEDAQAEDIRQAVTDLRDRGFELEARVAWEPADMVGLAREAANVDQVRRVVACGGDGTINAVLRGLLESGQEQLPSLGVLPRGTGNDFATAAGVPLGDPLAALQVVVDQPARAIDVIQAGERFFMNVATGGFGTDVTVGTPPALKSVLGRVAYLLTGLSHLTDIRAQQARIEGPDFEWSGDFLALAVGNARSAGGGVVLCPDAVVDDGLLDVAIVPEFPRSEVLRLFGDFMQEGMATLEPKVIHRQLSAVRVVADEPIQLNLDGEPRTLSEVDFKVLPGRIEFHLPEGSPLLGGSG